MNSDHDSLTVAVCLGDTLAEKRRAEIYVAKMAAITRAINEGRALPAIYVAARVLEVLATQASEGEEVQARVEEVIIDALDYADRTQAVPVALEIIARLRDAGLAIVARQPESD